MVFLICKRKKINFLFFFSFLKKKIKKKNIFIIKNIFLQLKFFKKKNYIKYKQIHYKFLYIIKCY